MDAYFHQIELQQQITTITITNTITSNSSSSSSDSSSGISHVLLHASPAHCQVMLAAVAAPTRQSEGTATGYGAKLRHETT
jgi:hypothetical protein